MKTTRFSNISRIVTPDVGSVAFSLDVWLANPPGAGELPPGDGSGGTTQVPVESSNPLTNRVARINAFARTALQCIGSGTLRSLVIGGTNLTFQPWFYDNALAAWVKFGPAVVTTVATTNIAAVSVLSMSGAKFFLQVTAQTGNPTQFGYSYL